MVARDPIWVQALTYGAEEDRALISGLFGRPSFADLSVPAPQFTTAGGAAGVVGSGDLAVTENNTPDMSVNVAAGVAVVPGTEASDQGAYVCGNDATVNVIISAADPTNARKDLIVFRVRDSEYSGATDSGAIEVVTGTPAGSPVDPTVPENSLVLARVDVAAAETAINTADITDLRTRARALGGVAVVTSTTRPTVGSLYEGLVIYETDTDKVLVYDGTNFVETADLAAWDAYTPTDTNVTVGNGSRLAAWRRSGRTVTFRWELTFGSTSAFTGTVSVGLPTAAVSGPIQLVAGLSTDTGTGTHLTTGRITSGAVLCTPLTSGGGVTATAPFTWTTGDVLSLGGTYEAAA